MENFSSSVRKLEKIHNFFSHFNVNIEEKKHGLKDWFTLKCIKFKTQ